MKILIVASYNKNRFAPFILEQANALQKTGHEIDFFCVIGKGYLGYLKAFKSLQKKIKTFQPDIIHAHYGLCGLLANLQRSVPVVTTYHGSDINIPNVLRFSKITMNLSAWNIFVSEKCLHIAKQKNKFSLLPCGIDLPIYNETDIAAIKKQLNWQEEKKHVLFAGAFDNTVKNAPLAKEAIRLLKNTELIELKGYTREQVTSLLYASDVFLMTSFTEGSPQVIKEAMACGCPIVSVNVGDVAERIEGLEGCFVVERNPQEIAKKIQQALSFARRTNGRKHIIKMELTNDLVAKKLVEIYKQIISKKQN
ncbi:MAG: glycosyltransferase family 4 protein [Paludibacteraceae bacterium]|nr:glycosyltransferase family 4 protein [Paludibacteraceae bacterium]